jgi:hypothetical protein
VAEKPATLGVSNAGASCVYGAVIAGRVFTARSRNYVDL